jgi:peptidyl-prolyl cis-trans isomerase-like protein 2
MLPLVYHPDKRLTFCFLIQIQTGDPTGTGSGGQSYWGIPFRDEHDARGAAKHDSRGIVAMANKGANTNG